MRSRHRRSLPTFTSGTAPDWNDEAMRGPGKTGDHMPGSIAMAIDLAYLHEITNGNRARAERIGRLFLTQCQADFAAIASAQSQQAWRDAVHSLKSSAAAVGARALVDGASAAEDLSGQAWQLERSTTEASLRALARAAQSEVQALLAGNGADW